MAMWKIVAQQETRNGSWLGSEQVPTFYVDAHSLSEAVRKAVDVMWDGRNPSGPLHLSVLEVAGGVRQEMAGAKVRSFTVIRDGDEMPVGRAIVCRFMLGRITVDPSTSVPVGAGRVNQGFASAVCDTWNGNQRV